MTHPTTRRDFLGSALIGGMAAGVLGSPSAEADDGVDSDRIILLLIDTDIPGVFDPNEFLTPDPWLTEMVDIVGGGETYDSILADAEDFYQWKFGIDFSVAEPDENGFKFLDGIMLMPILLNPVLRYTATTFERHGKILSTRVIRDAAFVAVITGDDVMLHGTYGGDAGKPAVVGDVLAFGAYGIPYPNENSSQMMTLRYRSFEPMRANADGNVVIACEIYDSPFGGGLAYGLGKFLTVGEGDSHVFVRNVITFPGLLTTI